MGDAATLDFSSFTAISSAAALGPAGRTFPNDGLEKRSIAKCQK